MENKEMRVVVDTNVIVSAIVFGGIPRIVLNHIFRHQIIAVTSPVLLAEFVEVLSKKFRYSNSQIKEIEEAVRQDFEVVIPRDIISCLEDEDDNRVLEAAKFGKCDFILTGDNDLLRLEVFEGISILTPRQFIENLQK